MGKITYITGGARSGKSRFAEGLLEGKDDVLYIATSLPFDNEMKERIKKHREQRNPGWRTVEAYRDMDRVFREETGNCGYVLLDCLTIMVSNLMVINSINWEKASGEMIDATERLIISEVEKLISGASGFCGQSIIVANETGMGIVPPTPLGRHFRDMAGRANQYVASKSHEAYLLVSGIPVKIKGD